MLEIKINVKSNNEQFPWFAVILLDDEKYHINTK